jgi:hypothetical protein
MKREKMLSVISAAGSLKLSLSNTGIKNIEMTLNPSTLFAQS